jgi:hypothetical protein
MPRERRLWLTEEMCVVLRPGPPTMHLALCIEALMAIVDHHPRCPEPAEACLARIEAMARDVLGVVLEPESTEHGKPCDN